MYEEMKIKVAYTAERPEGYNGQVIRIGLAEVEGAVYEVSCYGYYKSRHKTLGEALLDPFYMDVQRKDKT